MARHAAHIAGGGVVDDAAQDLAFHSFRGSDALAQRGGRVEAGVLHAEGVEDTLGHEPVERLAADLADDLAQQHEIDVAVDEALAGFGDGPVNQRQPDAGVVTGPFRLEVHVRPQS